MRALGWVIGVVAVAAAGWAAWPSQKGYVAVAYRATDGLPIEVLRGGRWSTQEACEQSLSGHDRSRIVLCEPAVLASDIEDRSEAASAAR